MPRFAHKKSVPSSFFASSCRRRLRSCRSSSFVLNASRLRSVTAYPHRKDSRTTASTDPLKPSQAVGEGFPRLALNDTQGIDEVHNALRHFHFIHATATQTLHRPRVIFGCLISKVQIAPAKNAPRFHLLPPSRKIAAGPKMNGFEAEGYRGRPVFRDVFSMYSLWV